MEKIYLGVDWGEKRIGLAIGNSVNQFASLVGVVSSVDEILQIIKEEKIDQIVLGNPIKMSGEKNNNPKFLQFLENLKKQIKIPLTLYDERLSSQAIKSLEGCKKTKASKDAVSAMIILNDYFTKYGRSND